jgi:hypothetical protein
LLVHIFLCPRAILQHAEYENEGDERDDDESAGRSDEHGGGGCVRIRIVLVGVEW